MCFLGMGQVDTEGMYTSHQRHHFNIIVARLGYLPTVLQLDSTVTIIVAASSNKSASVVI
jgi:hypothetical protein